MIVLILAGGHGSRIKRFTNRIKPLVVIAGQPILCIQLKQLEKYEVYINCNKEHERLLKQYGNLIIEEKRLGNATPIKKFAEQINEDFLVVFCDSFNNINFSKFIESHKKSNLLMTLAVKNISKRKSFGLTTFDNDKKVTGFTRQRFVNTGIYICKPEIKELILKNVYQDIDRDLIPRLIKKQQLGVHIHTGYWYDVGQENYWNKHRKEDKKEFDLQSKLKTGEKKNG